MNTRRLLCIFCLLALPAVGGKLDAQTVAEPVRQRNDSVGHAFIHQIGFDIRPGMWFRQTVSLRETMRSRKPSTNHFPYI